MEALAGRERALLLQLLPKDDVDDRGIVLEVRQKKPFLMFGNFLILAFISSRLTCLTFLKVYESKTLL